MPVIDCECPEDRLEVRRFKTGSVKRPRVYRLQCQACGRKQGRPLDPLDLPDGIKAKSVQWAVPKRMKPRPNSMQRRRKKKSRSTDRQAQNARVKERDNYTCQGCGFDDDPSMLEVHHIRYPDEPEDDVPDSWLQTTCGGVGGCNMAERNERMAGGKGGRVGVGRCQSNRSRTGEQRNAAR